MFCSPAMLVEQTESRRVCASAELDATRRAALGQFFTPAPIASLLAGMFDPPADHVRLLDAGAGVGSLTAALVSRANTEQWSATIAAHVIEVDEDLIPSLKETLHECEVAVPTTSSEIHTADFIEWACDQLGLGLLANDSARFELAILNPPYRKLNTASRERQLLSAVGIETTNLYAAFVALALRLLVPGGQLVAITPRSFCNGPYFKAFRRELLEESVSTCRVVDFRAQEYLRMDPGHDTVPLLYPLHLREGRVRWRVVATVLQADDLASDKVAIDALVESVMPELAGA